MLGAGRKTVSGGQSVHRCGRSPGLSLPVCFVTLSPQQKFILSQFSSPEGQTPGVARTHSLWGPHRGRFLTSCGPWAVLVTVTPPYSPGSCPHLDTFFVHVCPLSSIKRIALYWSGPTLLYYDLILTHRKDPISK
jgi:hypothetical protein